ncbi:CBS-domain-containing membrane protein [Thioflavicoccus mobilis 8321]|uniref:CBS-domain-containing membrane protein n=1 Tax=Thioflavicoccus mobilis 8321 TaxID=765912 RepID=L0H1F4_9GAMM|nr:CBS domain-containing protein [Thioflavicoccus mobilis]AGA92036.1 CBS-domain-containing membrane protein [Thioflavicoccus mobilis 8321]
MSAQETELTDEDVLDAMRRIPGYLDISTEDFRAIYRLAQAHASERLFRQLRAGALMRTQVAPLRPDMPAGEAARALVAQSCKGLPVVDDAGQVVGILTETDLLRCLGVGSYLELLFDAVEHIPVVEEHCGERSVTEVMTAPAITVRAQDGFTAMMRAFRRHPGRTMPVVDADGHFLGMLLRKDFLHACHIEDEA